MVDQDPLPRWTHGRVTLLGDAAHPMVPRGSNGAGQAILDARVLAGALHKLGVGTEALDAYDRVRVKATTDVVLTNRSNPPDAILREVFQRTGDKPFDGIEDDRQHRGAAGDLGQLQAGRRLRPCCAEGAPFLS